MNLQECSLRELAYEYRNSQDQAFLTNLVKEFERRDQIVTHISEINKAQVSGTHYQTSIAHWDYVLANEIPYLEAQVIKYLTRWRKKNGFEDVLKAKHFLDKLIDYEQSKQKEKT